MQGSLGPFDKSYPRLYPANGPSSNKRGETSEENNQTMERLKNPQSNTEKIDQQISKIMRENNGNIFEVHSKKNNPHFQGEPQGTNQLLK